MKGNTCEHGPRPRQGRPTERTRDEQCNQKLINNLNTDCWGILNYGLEEVVPVLPSLSDLPNEYRRPQIQGNHSWGENLCARMNSGVIQMTLLSEFHCSVRGNAFLCVGGWVRE